MFVYKFYGEKNYCLDQCTIILRIETRNIGKSNLV